MPDRIRTAPPPIAPPLVAAARTYEASQASSNNRVFQYDSWQEEAWGYYDSLGELNYGVTWLASALSRVRITAAELVPGGDEPEPLAEGPAAELVEALGGGIAGRAAIMKSLGVQLSVPGEGWLVAERPDSRIPLNQATWTVKSTDEIRVSRGKNTGYEIRVDDNVWQPLGPESLPVRIWEPHPRWSWKATSAARSAIPIMRRIDLLDRRIIAQIVSRLAMNGVLLIPQEGTISVPAQYADEPDPFVAMFIDVAGRNIREPGSATASIPIPVKFQSELIEKWKHLTFGDGVDEHLLDEREKELGRLATSLNMPAEVVKGLGGVNHWSSWQIEESAIKLHISPLAEVIVGGLTSGYLEPMLKAAGHELVGPNGGRIVAWYDTSELTARPDKSQTAQAAHDRVVINDTAYRRELGMDEGDAPDEQQLRHQLLVKLAALGNADAFNRLFGDSLAPTPGQRDGTQTPVPGGSQPSGPGDTSGNPAPPVSATRPGTGTTPPTRGEPPPPPDEGMAAISARISTLLAGRSPIGVGSRASPATNGHHHNGKTRDGPHRRRR